MYVYFNLILVNLLNISEQDEAVEGNKLRKKTGLLSVHWGADGESIPAMHGCKGCHYPVGHI
jgi:hypothetical protein